MSTRKNGLDITLPDGSITLVDEKNLWIKEVFPHWRKVGIHVRVTRYIKTEYGQAREEYYLHKLICKAPPGIEVDHINRNGLDNREENLRWATRSQNMANGTKLKVNTSGYRGVSKYLRSKSNPWRAYCTKNKKVRHIGYFSTAEEAAKAYDKVAKEVHGRFAYQNFPEG